VFDSIDLLPAFRANVSKLITLGYVENASFMERCVSDVSLPVSLALIAVFTIAAFAYCLHLFNIFRRFR
jgi:ABC-2 type transport system permease protein